MEKRQNDVLKWGLVTAPLPYGLSGDGALLWAAPGRVGAGTGGGTLMDFATVRTQVSELLHCEGRVAYRALKLQFQLNDEHLEALKDDLIYAKHLAVDEDGRVLVWTGGTEVPQLTPQLVPPPGPAPATAATP